MKLEPIDINNKKERFQFTAYVGQVANDIGLMGEYENVINILIKDLKSTGTRIDEVAHPILYMMRHSLELGYKANFQYLSTYSHRSTSNQILGSHNLHVLHAEYKEHFDLISTSLSIDPRDIDHFNKYYQFTTDLIQKLGPTEASSFRYTKNTKGQVIFNSTDKIDLGELKENYDRSITMLAFTADLIAPYTDYVDLMNRLPNFSDGQGTVRMTFPEDQLEPFTIRLNSDYEQIEKLKWLDTDDGQILSVIILDGICYLTPTRR